MQGVIIGMMGTHKKAETIEELQALIAESNEKFGSIRVWINEVLILDATRLASSLQISE